MGADLLSGCAGQHKRGEDGHGVLGVGGPALHRGPHGQAEEGQAEGERWTEEKEKMSTREPACFKGHKKRWPPQSVIVWFSLCCFTVSTRETSEKVPKSRAILNNI